MTLSQQIMEDMKQAMRAKDSSRLGTIRLLRAKIKNVEIDNGEQNDQQVQQLVSQMIKQWQDALIDYKRGNRDDLVKEAEEKIKVLQEYLPAQLSDDKLMEVISSVIKETGLTQVGPVIGKVKQQVGSQADGARIAKLVNQVVSAS